VKFGCKRTVSQPTVFISDANT